MLMGEHHAPLSPAEAQALAERVAAEMYPRDRASRSLGMKVAKVGPGHAELTMTVRGESGRTGIYDIEVHNQRGEKIAFFRGKSYRIKGHVIEEPWS